MPKTLALLACLLLASTARAAAQPAADDQAPSGEVITPLNVRDPSALVMGPGGKAPGLSIMAPAPRAGAPGAGTKAQKTSTDKTGVQQGKRAVALPFDDDQLLGVKPGDRVDVLAVFEAVTTSGAKEKLSATMLQNVRVLGVVTTKDLRAKGVLTLELNPVEAEYALLGVRQAELGVAVRAPGDVELHPMEMVGFRRFFQ